MAGPRATFAAASDASEEPAFPPPADFTENPFRRSLGEEVESATEYKDTVMKDPLPDLPAVQRWKRSTPRPAQGSLQHQF
jgi:hypothetical protein